MLPAISSRLPIAASLCPGRACRVRRRRPRSALPPPRRVLDWKPPAGPHAAIGHHSLPSGGRSSHPAVHPDPAGPTAAPGPRRVSSRTAAACSEGPAGRACRATRGPVGPTGAVGPSDGGGGRRPHPGLRGDSSAVGRRVVLSTSAAAAGADLRALRPTEASRGRSRADPCPRSCLLLTPLVQCDSGH